MNFASRFSKVENFSSIIISHTPHLLFLHFVTPCVVCSLNVEEVGILFKIFGLSLAFNDLFVSSISLILSLFSRSRFFLFL